MPQTTQHCFHILLLWTTIISLIQIVLIIVYFTVGHNGLSQNCSAVQAVPNKQTQEQNKPLNPSDDEPSLGKGKMLTFKATNGNTEMKWVSKDRNLGVVSEGEDGLLIMKDGYYFLNLQVTLSSCKGLTRTSEHTVTLKWNDSDLLVGWINTKTNSTGLLSKVEQLSAGGKLTFSITPSTKCVNESESVTHLDIIYMVKP